MRKTRPTVRLDPDTWQYLSASDELDGWFAELADPDASMRATAAFTLGFVPKRRRPRALRVLRLALDDADEVVAESAAASLAQLHDLQSLPAIERLMNTGRPRERSGAVWAVGELIQLANEADRRRAMAALRTFHRRARGWSRHHATLMIERLEADLGVSPTDAADPTL